MPHEWNNTWVVTVDELVPGHYKSLDALKKSIQRYKSKPYGIKKVQNGGGGHPMLVAFDSLPAHVQEGMGDPRKIGHLLERFYKVDQDAVTYYTDTYRLKNNESLSLKHLEEYITNASVLKACIALKEARESERRSKGGSLKGVLSTVCRDAAIFNDTLEKLHGVRHTLPLSEKRFKMTLKEFSKAGNGFNYESLVSARLRNSNAKKVTDELLELLNKLFAGQGKKPTRTEVGKTYDAFLGGYVQVVDDSTGELYDPANFKPLSERIIVSWLGKWEERIATYKLRSGDRQKLMGQFKPYHSLDKPQFAGSIISIDDRQPPFEYAKGKRAWFYNGIDLASEAFTCWVYGKSKDGIIVDFYRQLVRNYTEWGFKLPYELEAESSLNSSFQNSFLRPGAMFREVRIEANNARGKRIEGYYRPLRYGVEKSRRGWLARPFALSEPNQAAAQPAPLIPYNEIIEGCLRDIEDWNNSPHSVHKDKTRWEVFAETQHPALEETNWYAILPHLGYVTRTSCHTGIIKLNNAEFLLGYNGEVYTGENLINAMKRVEGKTFDVFWLDDNAGKVMKALVYYQDQIICEAVPKPTYNRAKLERTERDDRNRAIMSAYVATIEGYQRRKAAGIGTVAVIDTREKTLNRKFVIGGVKRYEAREEKEVEILPDIDEKIYEAPPSGFVRDLKDRF